MPIPFRTARLTLLAAALLTPLAAATAPAQDWAKTRLDASPRHHEYVTLKHGDRSLQALVVYPEVKQKATVVVMIHEIFGLSDWAKEMADELAAAGYIVVAPDLLSGAGPNNGGTEPSPPRSTPSPRPSPASRPTRSPPTSIPPPTTARSSPPRTAKPP